MNSACATSGTSACPPPYLADLSDIELRDRLLQDDAEAWREFNRRYARLLYSCISRVTNRFSSRVRRDEVQEIYATLCLQLLANNKRKLRSFEPERGNKLGSWLGMLATHCAYDFLRTMRREPVWAQMAEADVIPSSEVSPFESTSLRENARIVAELIESFSDKDRTFIQLYYGEGHDPERIAQLMKINVKTVYSKKHKISARLEALLAEHQLAA